MRKRRVILFNEDPFTRRELKSFFDARGYETMIFREPAICPVYGDGEQCPNVRSCSDLIILNNDAAAGKGVDLIRMQQELGCKLPADRKAVIARSFSEEERTMLASMGAVFLARPLDFSELEKWVVGCESRMDLTQPVAIRRKEEREASHNETLSVILPEGVLEGVPVVNKSICGICFRTSHRLIPEQVITLRGDSHGATEDALIRWVKADGDGTFLTGLSFCI